MIGENHYSTCLAEYDNYFALQKLLDKKTLYLAFTCLLVLRPVIIFHNETNEALIYSFS